MGQALDITYHYPPELFQLLVDVIPRLNRSKNDVLIFFRGSGVPRKLLSDIEHQLATDRDSINKFDIVRTVLTRLNEAGESRLRERREVLKRVVEFEDFSTCWANDQLKAQGLVAQIRSVVNVKDSFTRMRQERSAEREKHKSVKRKEAEGLRRKQDELDSIKADLYRLFSLDDARKRGILLEGVLNRFFAAAGIHVRDSFARVGERGEGVIEQIDGIIELEGEIYLVEMKWLKESAGVGDVSQHLVRVFTREASRGIFISYTEYTPSAISTCRDALAKMVVVLCTLDEFVLLLERGRDIRGFFKEKLEAAIIDKDPYRNVIID